MKMKYIIGLVLLILVSCQRNPTGDEIMGTEFNQGYGYEVRPKEKVITVYE